MSVIDQILGQAQSIREDDVPPAMAARPKPSSPARKMPPKDEEDEELKKKAAKIRSSSVVAGILGMTESDEESIIPQDAKPFDTFSTQNVPGMKEAPKLDAAGPAEPTTTNNQGEELIPPTAALVAPDVTPNVLQLIDPSQVPAPPTPPAPVERPVPPTGAPAQEPQPALDTILGRQNPNPAPQAAPVSPEAFEAIINPIVAKSKIAEALMPAMDGGAEMPKHVESDGKSTYNVFRRFNG